MCGIVTWHTVWYCLTLLYNYYISAQSITEELGDQKLRMRYCICLQWYKKQFGISGKRSQLLQRHFLVWLISRRQFQKKVCRILKDSTFFSSECLQVNKARKQMFATMGRQLEHIPKSVLLWMSIPKEAHIKGACMEANTSSTTTTTSTRDWGWQENAEHNRSPIWSKLQETSKLRIEIYRYVYVQDLVKMIMPDKCHTHYNLLRLSSQLVQCMFPHYTIRGKSC